MSASLARSSRLSTMMARRIAPATSAMQQTRTMTNVYGTHHVLDMNSYTVEKAASVLDLADKIKSSPEAYSDVCKGKSMVMFFAKPSLRTRLSFEIGMSQMGGTAIYYPTDHNSTLAGGKETIADVAQVVSRYADIITARVFHRSEVKSFAENCTIPVINALDDWGHPMQVLADFQTIREQRRLAGLSDDLKGVKLAFVGDLQNNMTYDLMRGGALMGMHISVSGPTHDEYAPSADVVADTQAAAEAAGGSVTVHTDPFKAVEGADFIYGDSIMSYGVSRALREARIAAFRPFQITSQLMDVAGPNAKFMHCLPAVRDEEVTADVMDGPRSIVFDQAENRLHVQKAVILQQLGLNQ